MIGHQKNAWLKDAESEFLETGCFYLEYEIPNSKASIVL